MKIKYAFLALTLAASSAMVSCAGLGDLTSVKSSQLGVPQQVVPATVVSVADRVVDTESSGRNVGTAIGAAVGAGAGGLLGKDRGRAVSTIGFGALGALAGRYLVDAMGRTKAQQITVRVDATGDTYSFIQVVSKQIGPISAGMHGQYYHGNNAQFIPDGAAGVL